MKNEKREKTHAGARITNGQQKAIVNSEWSAYVLRVLNTMHHVNTMAKLILAAFIV